jgi:hypothetical protein
MKNKIFVKLLLLAAISWVVAIAPAFAQQGTYPQLDISGFKKWEYKKAGVSPQRNYFSGLTQLGGYYPTYTGGPWQERLQLRILGQLSPNLSVSYDLEQQPEVPDRFDVKVKYYNNELTFGDITANFSGNEFASTSKYLNGVMLTAKESWYDIITVPSAKLKSQTQNLTSQKGNNTKGPYNLGHGSIVEGSERIELNDNLLVRNVDYTIDYFEGKITFNTILTQDDEFKYSYEYTNILDLFFPALSKRDFFGFQSRFTIDPDEFGKPLPVEQPVIGSAREIFPSPQKGTIESERSEEEAMGEFSLANIPLVRFSETLTFMGTELRKNEDYIIRYNEGKIKLLTRFLPNEEDKLTVEYQYHKTTLKNESIAGIGSRGPYQLANKNIVPESERVEVDGKLFVRDLDYTINYKIGEIVFGVIVGPTSLIKAKYLFNDMALPAEAPSKFPKELKLGVTYLRESAKAGSVTNSSVDIESAGGQSIIDDGYTIYLSNRPVVSTGDAFSVTVRVDGNIVTQEVDYAFPESILDPNTGYYSSSPEANLAYLNERDDPSDGYYTGTVKFINQAIILPTSEVTVTYAYHKSIIGRYSGVGEGIQGPYYLKNIRNIVPGSDTILVWNQGSSTQITYTRNSSFEADAGDNGYSINYNADNPSITFNQELDTNKNFEIIYQYVPPSGSTSQDIAQSVLGFDGSFNIGETFKIDTAYAKSEIDQVIAKVATSELFSGSNTKNYTLHSPQEIIENSEMIYINDRLLNKDIDYYISYAKPGQITFYYITPGPADVIKVEYDYQETGGSATQVDKKTGSAYRLGATTKIFGDKLTLSGNTKKIDYDFTPMGGTSIGLGSTYYDYGLKFEPGAHDFVTNYSYKQNHNPLANERTKFSKSYDHSLTTGFNPGGRAQVNVGLRKYWSLDDKLTPSSAHGSDTQQEAYSLGVTPTEWKRGVLAFNQTYDIRRSFSQTDTKKDSGSFSESTSDFYHAKGDAKFTDRITAGYDFQKSEPRKTSLDSSSAEAVNSLSRTIDTSYNFTTDLTFGPLDKWTARVNLLDHIGETVIKDFNPTDEVVTTRNETYHTDFVPFNQLKASADHNRQEKSTLVIDGVNPRTERTSANLSLTPYNWTSVRWNGSNSESIPETGEQYKTTGKAHTYALNYNPISHKRFKLVSVFSLSDSLQTAPSGTTEGVRTDTDTFSQNYGIVLLPHEIAPLNLGFIIENYKNKNNHPNPSSQIDTETENYTYNLGAMVTPNPTWNISTNYNEKITKVIKDLHASPSDKKKTVLDSKFSYKVFDWGTFIYNHQNEKNGGEVQSGSVAILNLEKTTQSYSLNINMPVDNPVLTSFVFIASLKNVDYRDNSNSDNNFIASLMTFEGTLNF